MKAKNYISAFRVAILLFSFIQTVKAQTWEDLGNPEINGEAVTDIITIEGFGDSVYLCTDKGLFKSMDNGSTFVNLTWLSGITQNKTIRCIYVDPDNGNIYIGGNEAVFKSTDNGNSWTPTILTNLKVNDIDKMADNILVGYSDTTGNGGGVYFSSDELVSAQESTIADLGMFDFEMYNNTMFLAGKLAVYKSTDNGETFSVAGTGHPANATYFKMLGEGSSLFVGDVFGTGLYKSADNGETWENPDPSTYFGFCQVFDITSANGYILAVVDGSQCVDNEPIKLSTDDGMTWNSGLFNINSSFFSELGKNESGSCIFVYSPSEDKLYRICDLTVGITENDFSAITVTPNPTNGFLLLTGMTETAMVELYNIQGKLLKEYPQITNNNTIDLSEFSAGLYFINVKGEKGVRTFKVIKE